MHTWVVYGGTELQPSLSVVFSVLTDFKSSMVH